MTNANTIEGASSAPEPTAAEAYAARLRRLGVMAGWLAGQLAASAAGPEGGRCDWGHVGDLAEADRRLAAALAALVGTDEAAVAAAVDEAVG
ncbi:MAG TPA: hypothetical protein VF796_18665 [Humisphaera sp.]